jgi:hypothetical protein
MPQSVLPSGGQVGIGMALVLEGRAWAVAEVAFAWVEANAPVRARATTRVRTKSFICSYSLFGYSEWAEQDIFLDTPDEVTLGFMVS